MRGNILKTTLQHGTVKTIGSLYQYDYGQKLLFTGVTLPQTYEVHFSNTEKGSSVTMLGDNTGVEIPDALLQTGENVHVWIYLHNGLTDGETEYHCQILVKKRAQPTNATPTPVQQDIITQAIAALNDGVEQSAASADAAARSQTAAAGSAVAAAESAQAAGASEEVAGTKAREAAQSAAAAAESKREAGISESAAYNSANRAQQEADKAEQAAAAAGYLFFAIMDGDLILQRTENAVVDFALIEGDLYVMGVTE